MEFKSSFLLLVIASFLFLLLWLANIYKQKTKVKTVVHNLPPGPWKLPVIGNLHQLALAGSLPHHTLRDLSHKHGPLMHPLLFPRECREQCKIGGYEIPVKTKVIVNAWALGRDPKYWYDADKFIPERFHDDDGTSFDFKGNKFEYIPFGAGRRMCPGISLGLTNIELPLAALLYHFDWELPNGMKPEDLDMTEAFGAAVGRRSNLYLIPTPFI